MSDHQRLRRAALKAPGVRSIPRTLELPDADGGVVTEFPLHYVRTGPRTRTPVVVLPGGPGLGSVLPYKAFRRRAAGRGLDVVMVEHRGVGLSRRDVDDRDLPRHALTVESAVDDVEAVLAAEGIDEAVIVGSSYGSYLAQAYASTYPDRVAGLVLDSPVLSTDSRSRVSEYSRALLHDGTLGDGATRAIAARIRGLIRSGSVDELDLGNAARIVYEFADVEALNRLLDQIECGRAGRTWSMLTESGKTEIGRTMPYYMEFDLVGEIAFRELGYGEGSDGRIFDGAHAFLPLRESFSPFAGESFDHAAALPNFDFPVLVLSGDRDLRTPRPVAEQIVDLTPRSRLVPVPDHGHSALDTHVDPLLAVARGLAGTTDRSTTDHDTADHGDVAACDALDRLVADAIRVAGGHRRGGPSRHLGVIVSLLLRTDRTIGVLSGVIGSRRHRPEAGADRR